MSVRLPSKPKCPNCGVLLDAADSIPEEGQTPEPGNVTICSECSRVLVFTEEMQFRYAMPADLEALPAEALMALMVASRAIRMRIAFKQAMNN